MEKQTINCLITEQEHERLKELKAIFKVKTLSDVFEPVLAHVAEIKEFEIKAPIRNSDTSWKRIFAVLRPEVHALIERYARSNFRDLTNTIRFLINASYENITNGKK